MVQAVENSLLDPAHLKGIEDYSLLARVVVDGAMPGIHRSLRQGRGNEFFQYRPYERGEDMKVVDWKVFAKRDELVAKTFQEDTNFTVYLVIDASAPIGRGDRLIAEGLPPGSVVVVTKCDQANRDMVLQQLVEASAFEAEEYFPVSGVTGEGVEALIDYLESRMTEGPAYFPPDQVTDLPEPWFVAELVREQLLSMFRDELPYSIATRITEWDWPRIRCEILVERDSQKGMVIGRKGEVLKEVGIATRKQLANNGEGVHLELHVKVEKDWQRRRESLDRLLDFHEPD